MNSCGHANVNLCIVPSLFSACFEKQCPGNDWDLECVSID